MIKLAFPGAAVMISVREDGFPIDAGTGGLMKRIRWMVNALLTAGLIANAWSGEDATPDVIPPDRGPLCLLTQAQVEVHPRLYYMYRHFSEPRTQESFALGGWAAFESGEWNGLKFGLTPYTSQKLYGDKDRDGANLLASGQEGYTVLGEAYVELERWRSSLKFWRQTLDTPFINPFDAKMTPVTVEALTLQSVAVSNVTLMASHVFGIKPWTSTRFVSLTEAAGVHDTNRPVTLLGATFGTGPELQFQIWNYLAYDFMNLSYAQLDSTWNLHDDLSFTLSAQALKQWSIGDELLGDFQASMGGLLGGVSWKGLTFTLGGTVTENSDDVVNPWGGYPGFTSIMEEDCDLKGEMAWVGGLAYDFKQLGLDGLSALINHTEAWTAEQGSLTSPQQREWDMTIDYRCPGRLKAFWLRLRAARVDNSLSTADDDYEDYRAILNYSILL